MTSFINYIGIDYSGAQTPISRLKGLRIFLAEGDNSNPQEVFPHSALYKCWTRKEIAHWLIETLIESEPTLVGIDHAFSFPLAYFEKHQISLKWVSFLEDFNTYWPTDEDDAKVHSLRQKSGADRDGNARWRRLTEEYAVGAKSVFHFGVPGQVAYSTHAGIPWLRFLRQKLKKQVHFWPFDGWKIPKGKSAIVEVYPSLWSRKIQREKDFTDDQHDAFSVAKSLAKIDGNNQLNDLLCPPLSPLALKIGQIEGWILGVMPR